MSQYATNRGRGPHQWYMALLWTCKSSIACLKTGPLPKNQWPLVNPAKCKNESWVRFLLNVSTGSYRINSHQYWCGSTFGKHIATLFASEEICPIPKSNAAGCCMAFRPPLQFLNPGVKIKQHSVGQQTCTGFLGRLQQNAQHAHYGKEPDEKLLPEKGYIGLGTAADAARQRNLALWNAALSHKHTERWAQQAKGL